MLKFSGFSLEPLQVQWIGPAKIQRVLFRAAVEALKSVAQAADSSGDGVSTQVPPLPPDRFLIAVGGDFHRPMNVYKNILFWMYCICAPYHK
jgi:hypothetical protein